MTRELNEEEMDDPVLSALSSPTDRPIGGCHLLCHPFAVSTLKSH